MRTETGQTIRLQDYAPPDWLVETVDLEFSLHPTATRVRATLQLKPNPKTAAAPLVLDGDGLKLVSLKLDDDAPAPETFIATPDRLTIPQPPQRAFRLEIETEVDPTANTQLSGLYRSSGTYCTQCEAEGFRRITYFPDRPDVMAVYSTRIKADKSEAPVLLANGNLAGSGDLPGGRHYALWKDPFPKPSYLFALVGGTLGSIEDRFTTMSGREVVLKIYVEPGKEDRCGYAMDSLKRAMRWDEEAFGREYDLDIFMIVAVSDFNMGAMENKGLNVFNDKYVLASPDTATDADFAGIESVIAHEYFHNWTGDRITCRDWFQLCLKEGLTVFRDQEFSADQRSRAVERIGDVRNLRNTQFVEDAGPLAHPVRPETYKEINNFYTTTVYQKGAEVVRMIETILGAQKFRAGMDLYFQRHDGEAATVEQFVQCFADASGRDMTQFMRWYSQAGTPQVTVQSRYDAQAKTLSLDLAQTVPPTPGQPAKQPMVIPLRLGLVGADGRDLPLTPASGAALDDGILLLTEPTKTVVFKNVDAKPRLSINREFSAPIKLVTDLTHDDLAFLAAHDSDPFNRWQAIQTIAMALLIENIAALRAGRPARSDDKLTAALAALLGDDALEPAFVALALAPPGEADIAREIGKDIDPDAIFRARRHLRVGVGVALKDKLADIYRRMAVPGAYSPDAASAGKRSLRNACLDLLAAGGGADAVARAERQYQAADNMTDRMAALSTLAQHPGAAREGALADFYRRYADNALVIDKWLALQAMTPEPDTLDRVRALTRHAAFDFANPNRIRALIGSFAQANPSQFNRADGQGYDFVADTILALDPKNPQVAARLATAFRTWRNLESGRRDKAQAALARIEATAGLSRDVSEIVERTLSPG
jgi:aminopeptidase N